MSVRDKHRQDGERPKDKRPKCLPIASEMPKTSVVANRNDTNGKVAFRNDTAYRSSETDIETGIIPEFGSMYIYSQYVKMISISQRETSLKFRITYDMFKIIAI